MDTFKPKGLIRRKHVEQHLIYRDAPILARKFLHFARNVPEIKFCIKSAKKGLICPVCEDSFLRAHDRNVCDNCLKTKVGKEYAYNIKQKNMKQTNLILYGVDNSFKNKKFREKMRKTNIKRYGVAYPMQSKKFMLKREATCKEKYGIHHPMKTEKCQRKKENTCLERYGVNNLFKDIKRTQAGMIEKYGVKNPMQIEKFIKKYKKTMIDRYGFDSPSRVPYMKKKIRNTMMMRYGVKHALQNQKFHHKALKSSNKIRNIKCGGRIYECQGYERFVVPKLVNKFGVSNVVSQFDPEFKQLKLEDRTYTPDFYIKNEDAYVDAKSIFTFMGILGNNNFLEMNREKQERLGDRLRFAVHIKDKTFIMPVDWHRWSKSEVKNYLN
jgi:hypothetical protein